MSTRPAWGKLAEVDVRDQHGVPVVSQTVGVPFDRRSEPPEGVEYQDTGPGDILDEVGEIPQHRAKVDPHLLLR
jgi:hypothetical protein